MLWHSMPAASLVQHDTAQAVNDVNAIIRGLWCFDWLHLLTDSVSQMTELTGVSDILGRMHAYSTSLAAS